MSLLTFFSSMERMSELSSDRKKPKRKRIIVPDFLLKLLLQNKTKLLKEKFNAKSVKEILSNKRLINENYFRPKVHNFYLGSQKYKSLDKNNNSENNKYTSPDLPKITEKKTIFNLRYKEDPRNYEKYKGLGKELIKIRSKNSNDNKAESNTRDKNDKKFNLFSKKINSTESFKFNNINNNNSTDKNLMKKVHYKNMTFLSPLPNSMLSRNGGKINNNFNNDELILNDLNNLLFNNYFYNNMNKQFEMIKNKKSIDNTVKHMLYHTVNSCDMCGYNSSYNNFNFSNASMIKSNKENTMNKKKMSVVINSDNCMKEYNNHDSNIEAIQRKFLFNKKNINHRINIVPFKFLNSFTSNTNKKKIQFLPKNNPIKLVSEFTHKYASQEEIQQKLSKKIIYFPLNTNIMKNNSKDSYYYFINKMYRNQIIEYMKHRTNWELITRNNNDGQKTINFEWKYMSNRLNFKNFKYEINKPNKKLRMVNLFERNYEVGNKKNMFINLINYCDKININAFDLVPFTIIINNTKDVDYCLEAISDVIQFLNKNTNLNCDIITNKKYSEHFWFDKNFENLNKQYININKHFLSDKNYWILKPTDLYQGKCIEICDSYEEISKKCKNMFKGVEKKFVPELVIKEEDLSDDEIVQNINSSKILNEENNTNNNTNNNSINNSNKKKVAYSKMYCSNEIIIQKYLDRPLLYYKRKFDIRCFVLVDSNLNVFFCREGHLKGSSEFYDLNNTNKLIHITNYSLQKKSSKFEIYEDGNEISYNDFKIYMKKKNISLDNFTKMINQIKYLVQISFKAVGKKLIKTNPILCFEIFGYDFIVDNDFKPWILEINNNPGLCISSPVIQKLVPRMLDDAFRLTIDKVFETRYSPDVIDSDGNYKSKYQLDGFNDEENVFEFLCNVN